MVVMPPYVSAQTVPPPPVPVTPVPAPSYGEPPVLPGTVVVPGPFAPPAPPPPPGTGAPFTPAAPFALPPPPPPGWIGPNPMRPQFAPPGWFGAFGIDVVVPNVRNRLVAPVTVSGVTDSVQLPSADLHWSGSPRVELGYRLPDGLGEFILSYRALITEGTETIPGFDALGSAFLKSRLNFNVIDLDYNTGMIDLAPLWNVSGTVGVRIAAIYFDSRATGMLVQERTSNNFVGAGPHAAFEATRSLDLIPGLALYGRLDGALVIGGVGQSFERTVHLGGGTVIGGATRVESTQAAPVLSLQLGLSYMPPMPDRWVRFTFGYQVDQWWSIGNAEASRGDLTIQGIFFRTQFNF
jgi:hypothetical protein